MKADHYRDLTLEQLEVRVVEEAENLMNLKMRLRSRTLDNPMTYRHARRELARVKTVLAEKRRETARED